MKKGQKEQRSNHTAVFGVEYDIRFTVLCSYKLSVSLSEQFDKENYITLAASPRRRGLTVASQLALHI